LILYKHKINNMENQTITLEQVLNAPVSRVWKVLTDKVEMKNWYFDLAEFIPEAGCKFQFWGGPSPDNQYLHLCEVTEAIPEKKLAHSWRYDGYQGTTLVTFELLDQDGETLLKFTHEGIDTFPKDNPDLAISNFIIGWNYIIHTALKNYIETGSIAM